MHHPISTGADDFDDFRRPVWCIEARRRRPARSAETRGPLTGELAPGQTPLAATVVRALRGLGRRHCHVNWNE